MPTARTSSTFGPPKIPKLVDRPELLENDVVVTAEPPAERSVLVDLIINVAFRSCS